MKRTRLMMYLSAGRRVLMFKSLPRHPPSSTHPDVVLVRVCDRLTAIVSHGALATDDNSPKSAESPAELLGLGLGGGHVGQDREEELRGWRPTGAGL